MTTEFRPVDCATQQPLAFNPGFVNQTIYGDRVETGWAWFPYKQEADNFWAQVGGALLRQTCCAYCYLAGNAHSPPVRMADRVLEQLAAMQPDLSPGHCCIGLAYSDVQGLS